MDSTDWIQIHDKSIDHETMIIMIEKNQLENLLREGVTADELVEGNLRVHVGYDGYQSANNDLYFAILVCDRVDDYMSPRWERHARSVDSAWKAVRNGRKSPLYKNENGN